MGDIKRNFSELQLKENQFLDLLKNEKKGINKTFKLKGPSSFLFSNIAVLALASCGGGGSSSSTPVIPPSSNNAPTMGADTAFTFTEDIPASFGIGTPADADGDTLTITVDSIPTGGVLTLSDGTTVTSGSTLTSAQLDGITFTPNANVNSSSDSIGTLTLTVTDGNGGSDSASFTFEISAVDDSPTAISVSDLSITENLLGDTVGNVSVTDVDSSSFTYSISGTDAALFEITSAGVLKLKDTVSGDYETKDSYSVTLTALDSSGNSVSKAFTVSALNVDESPTAITLSDSSITENLLGDIVGSISVTDVDSSTFTYVLSGTDASLFEITASGALKLKDDVSADYEAKSAYAVTLTASDSSGNSFSKAFTISTLDVADTDVSISNLSVNENVTGASIGTLSTGDNLTSVTYTLSGDDADQFVIDGTSLKLKSTVSADFEIKSTYSITVTSTNNNSGTSTSENFTVSVLDNTAPTAVGLSSTVFNENSTGVSIGDLSTTDSDANEIISYTLSGADAESFEVSGSTLKLISSVSADFETKSSYSVTVTATDSDSNTYSQDFSLTVSDIVEAETVSGTVVDGYVSGSTVKLLDVEGNVLATTTTNSSGQYSFEVSDNKGVKIVADGGIDTTTGEAVTITLTASKDSKYVSALTTIVEAAGSDAAAVLANLGLSSDFDLDTSNPLENLEAQKINANLINIIAIGEGLLEGAGLSDSAGDELIVSQIVNTLKTGTDISSATAIKSIIDTTSAGLSDDIKTKVGALSNNVAQSLANSSAQITAAGSVSQIATYQKAILDDSSSLLTSVVAAVQSVDGTLEVVSQAALESQAKAAALDLDVNVSPFITLDSVVSIKENILAGDGVLTAVISDPEGEAVTLALGGADAALFNINAEGKISFKDSPNFSAPLDANKDNVYIVDVIATDASGNGSTKTVSVTVLDVKGQGQAIDGYLVGATVWADLDGDGVIDPNEPTATTDNTGAFGLDADLPAGTVLYVEGGYDLGTGKPNDQVFKMTVSAGGADGTEELVISPVSTQISRAFSKGTVTLDEAQTKIAKAYGLEGEFENLTSFDPIQLAYEATSDAQAKAALTAQARNIMVSTLGETSMKVAEYFTTEIAPVVRSQISDLFKSGTQVLNNSSWDSAVDLREQPRITIELEGFEALLAKSSEVFNDKIIDAILSSTDLDKLFEMKKDGTGQFDVVIAGAVDSIVAEIKNTVLEEMGFDPATNYTTFKNLSDYDGETVTFLGSTKTMGEWAVLISDVLDSQQPGPSGKVSYGPDGGVTDMVGKYYSEQIAKVARHIEVITGKALSELTDDQIDQLVDMGMRYERGATFNDSNSYWIPFDEYGQEMWEQQVRFDYSGTRFNFDSNGNFIQGNTGQYQLTPDQIKAYLKDPALQLKDGNWGNEFTSYNWTSSVGDLGMYLALAKARNEADVATFMDALTPSESSMTSFMDIIDSFFVQGAKVFNNLVSGALDFTLDKFTAFVDKTIDIDNDSIRLQTTLEGLPVTTVTSVELDGKTYELKTTQGMEWLLQPWSDMNLGVSESGEFTYAISGGPDAARFVINEMGTISFKDTRPVSNTEGNSSNSGSATASTGSFNNPNNIDFDDADEDGTYLITVSVTQGDFTQEYDIELVFPDWSGGDNRNVPTNYSTLATDQYVIEFTEHTSTLRSFWQGTVNETSDYVPSPLATDGFKLGDSHVTFKDYIEGTEGSFTNKNATVTPIPPGMGSTDWQQIMTFFDVNEELGQAIVQPVLMAAFNGVGGQILTALSPLGDLIDVLNAYYQTTLTKNDPKTMETESVGDYLFGSIFNVLNYENLANLFSDAPSGNTPSVSYVFDSIPGAGETGSITLKLDLNNGRDYFKSDFINNAGFFVEATENLSTSINFNWTSDGSNLTIEIPDQTLTVTRTDKDGNSSTSTWENVSKTAISSAAVTNELGDGGVELTFEIASMFIGTGANSGSSLADFIQNNAHYSLNIEMEGTTFMDVTDSASMNSFNLMFDTASNKSVLSAESVFVNEADGVALVKVTLSKALDTDFTLEYVTLDGDQWNDYDSAQQGQDYFDASGSVLIPAGSTEATIQITILSDLENEEQESITVQFPQFQVQGQDGLNITTLPLGFENDGVSWNGSTNGVLVVLENQPVTSSEYHGLELIIADAPTPSEGYVDIRSYDNEGNAIKDNDLFRIHQHHETGKYYLEVQDGTLDFDNPQDRNGDNVYEITLTIVRFGNNGNQSIATTQDMIVVVRDGPDPTIEFGNTGSGNYHISENNAPVASLQELDINGKTVQAYFSSGQSIRVEVNTWNEQRTDDSGSPESILIFSYDTPVSYSITGGADASKFLVINGELMFAERPTHDSPADADEDNTYEVEVTASASGTTISKLWKVMITPSSEDAKTPLNPPAKLPVFILTETPEAIGDVDAPRNISGSAGDDYIQVHPDQFQYVHGGDGDDVLNPARDWGGHGHMTGGNGSDIFLFKANYMQDPKNFGIRDNSQMWTENSPDGIGTYDSNRDGVIDLSSEIDWSWVPIIADFTPGVDKIGLAVSGENGFNRPDFSVNDISFVQGTGDMANHTLVLFTGEQASNRGYEDGGILGVLLDVDASTITKSTDVITVGAKYEAQLGKIDIGATTVELLDTDGNPVKVQQLPNGDYVWFDANYNKADNEALHQVFSVSTDGFIYSGRASSIDYENPKDSDKDNVYEFQFQGWTFKELVIDNQGYGYQIDWNASKQTGQLSFTAVLVVEDDINDNLGKISIAETSYMNEDGTVNSELVELVLSQISAVQSSMSDIDFKSIAEEVNFDFSFFTTANDQMMNESWFNDDMNRQFEQFNDQLEQTFERNLLSKYNDFTDANSLGNLVGDSSNNILKGGAGNETIFGKAGNDTIAGGEGDDVIFGDQGSDTLSGGPGSDKLDGGAGSDRLIVDEGADVIDGGSGNDTILFSSLTELPQFISGGSGDDTLVLAGTPSTIGTTSLAHDNTDYTGIDLRKIVSAKETWSYQNAEGETVNEEGWSNRVESIEIIDLRDSQALLNAEKVYESYDAFQLSSNYFTVTDYIGSEGDAANTYKTKIIPYSEQEVGPGLFDTDTTDLALALGTESVLDYTNLQNLFDGDAATGKAPIFSFALASIPAAGQQGTMIVNFTLRDGYPDYWYAGDVASAEAFASTKVLKANIKLNWVSDGTTVKITMPPQTVAVSYESSDGILIEDEFVNIDSDVMSVSTGNGGTPQLDLKLTNLFNQNTSANSIDMSAFFESGGRYFLTTEFEGLDILAANATNNKSAMPFNAIQTLFRVEDGSLNWYGDDVIVNEETGQAQVTINISRAVSEDVTFTYYVYPATYGFINDDDTLETVKVATGADFVTTSGATWTGPNGETYPVGQVTIAAGSTTATATIPLNVDTVSESSEFFIAGFFASDLSDGTPVTKSSRHPQVEIENSSVFNDILNIDLDTLWRMSWDNRTWTIRGDDTDTVRLTGYSSTYDNSGDGTAQEFFEGFRLNGQQTIDSVVYNVYDLWDARVLIEEGVTVIYKKRDLGKVAEGENTRPDFWYKHKTVKENETDVFGAVRDSWDEDGDTLTYSIDENYGDGWLFDINATTGEVTWKNAPDYELPQSQSAQGIDDFSNFDNNMMRMYNQYQVKVIANDGSGATDGTATKEQTLWIEVKNVPDYEGYDSTNKIPFFVDMWGSETKFLDDAVDQSIRIKGFDLDFDTLTWEITGMYAWGTGDSKGWGTIWDSYRGNPMSEAPLQISSTGIVTPKSILSYEDGYTTFEIVVKITDGKSAPVTKQYHLQLEDSIADGSYAVNGKATLVGYLSGATVWQDLDKDGIKDASEPSTVTNARGDFTLTLSKATQDTPVMVQGGLDLGTGLMNDKVFGINSNLAFSSGRDWGQYALTPVSAVTLAIQEIDRSSNDKDTVIEIYKALGFENGWVEGDGNFHGDNFHQFNGNRLSTSPHDWDVHQFNVYLLENLINILGDVASKGSVQITKDALADIIAAVSGTTGAASVSSITLTDAQISSITTKGYDALLEAIAEIVTGMTAYDGFRLGTKNPVKIIDHEVIDSVMTEVAHTPSFSVDSSGIMTLNSSNLEIKQSTLQDALNLVSGAKGLKVQVEVGALPTSSETIQFVGKLIDGTNGTIDAGERAIEVRFNVTVDPSKEIGAADYVFVPSSEAITVIYTGEDGTVTETTITHDGAMVSIEVPSSGGAPVFSVDLMEVFSKGMPLTDLSSYFSNADGSNGDYYAELEFAGASLQTSSGESFTKVIAPFKVAEAPKTTIYVSDITVNENRGWEQLEVTLSKPATETFTINYKFSGGDATQNSDYWWWSDNEGYRQITFLKGQSNAIINVDVRNDDAAESTETFNIELVLDSASSNVAILGTDQVTVTIIDDDSSSSSTDAMDTEALVSKVISKVSATIATEIKTITDANSGTLNSSAATYSEILLSNSTITDVAAFIATEVTEESGIYDSIISAVMTVVQTYTSYLRGPNKTDMGYGFDSVSMANDVAALTIAINGIDLSTSSFITASADSTAEGKIALQTAIGTDIYTNSGFTYTGPAQIINNLIVSQKTINSEGSVYDNILMPVGSGLVNTNWDNIGTVTLGTSGNDTVSVANTGSRDILYNGGAGNDVITTGANIKAFVQGGTGNDTIKTTSNEYHRLQGGPGDDILSAVNFDRVLYEGGTGNDLFVIEASSDTWNVSQNFQGNDRNQDNKTDFLEMWQRPGVIYDFKDGADKIALKGDWSSKTIVIKQGTNEGNSYNTDMTEHTVIYSSSKDNAGNYDQIIGIIANTQATLISAADFVTVDASYNQTAIGSAVSSVTFASSLSFNGGTYVGPAQSGVIIYNATDSAPMTFSISGGNDASLFNIDSNTGALSFKTSKTLENSEDFNRDGTYDVTVTATQGASSVNGNVGVSISSDTTYASYSDLALVTSTDAQGKTAVYMTGKLTDDSAALTNGSINITLMHTSKGAEIRFEVNDWNGTLDADGSFVTNSRTLDSSVPDGTYFAQYLEIQDDSGNAYREYYRRAEDSSPFKGTLANPLYLGNSDTTTATYSNLALKVTEQGSNKELSITGSLSDDGSPLLVAELQIQLTHAVTGANKWLYLDSWQGSIASDGTFETGGQRIESSDPSGTWFISYIRLKDDAGNETTYRYTKAYDSSPLKATLSNDLYLGNTDKTAPSFSNLAVTETTNWEGKPAIILTGQLNEAGQEVSIQLRHSKSGENKWFWVNKENIAEDFSFESYAESFQASDPSGTWYVSYIRIKDASGNEIAKEWQGAQESSPLKVSITNSSYSGGNSGESLASDLTAPTVSNMTATVVDDGDGTYSLKITGNATDVGGVVNNLSLQFVNTAEAASTFSVNISGGNMTSGTGAFDVSHDLAGEVSGTYILKYLEIYDSNAIRYIENLQSGSLDSPIEGITFTHTSSISLTDRTAPVISNLTATKVNDGDDTYTLNVTGTLTDSSAANLNSIQIEWTNSTNAEGVDFYTSTSTFDSNGAFTISQNLDGTGMKGGTWIVKRIYVSDKDGNQIAAEISKAGTGSSLEGLTFSLDAGSATSTDFDIPVASNLAITVTAEESGDYTLKLTGTVTDSTGMGYVQFQFQNETGNSIHMGTGTFDGSGNFTTTRSLKFDSPGTYSMSSYYLRDSAGNELSKSTASGGSGSPFFGKSFTYATAPTTISFSETSINEESYGLSLGKVSVNGVEALGLYTLTLGGTDASSLEISSKGYLRLKDDVKLDYETKTTLEFTLKAQNSSGEDFTKSFAINVNDVNEAVSSSIGGVSGFYKLLDSDGSGIMINPGNDGEVSDVKPDIYELGITLDSIEEYSVTNSLTISDAKEDELLDVLNTTDENTAVGVTFDNTLNIVDNIIDEEDLLFADII